MRIQWPSRVRCGNDRPSGFTSTIATTGHGRHIYCRHSGGHDETLAQGMEKSMYDMIVIGGGPAGVAAAMRARELGASVALVERDKMGGTCTNDGCVPTRVLAKAARLVRDAEQFGGYGLTGERPTVHFRKLLDRTEEIVRTIRDKKQDADQLARLGIEIIRGEARFVDAHTVAVGSDRNLEGRTIIICAGGHARRLPFPGNELALTNSEVWTMEQLPRSMVIIGAAATGTQLASVFATFGAQVTLVEMAPQILPGEDALVGKTIAQTFARHGIDVITGIGGVERLEAATDGLRLHYTHDDRLHMLSTEAVIMATGWPGNAEQLNLDAAGVRSERSYIQVDDYLRTSTPHIFAAGDINGQSMLVESGSHEGRIAAENALQGLERDATHRCVPHGGFTDPEYGGVGLTEKQARGQGDPVIAVVSYADLDRAIIDGRQEGFCKLIVARDSREIIGAHVVGEQAVEVVQLLAAGMGADARVEQLAEVEWAYPTFTGIVGLAAREVLRELEINSDA